MNNKNINYLIVLRLWAAVIFAACCYWLFSDMELVFGPKIYLPLIYFYSTELYITKKMMVLIVPILMNIALWVPCYWSYIFIRLVLYAERIAAIIWIAFFIVFGGLGVVFMAQGSIVDFIFVSAICMASNEVLYRNFMTDKYKEKFSVTFKTEKEIMCLTAKLVMVFYLFILILLMGEYVVQRHITENLQVDYLQVETHNSIKRVKENTVEELPYSKSWRKKLSRDEKMLLVKVWLNNNETKDKNLFVIDLASMETINILAGSNTSKKNSKYNDYEFTPDSKYVVVGNRVLDNPKIKFAVLDITTGKADTRFSDPQGLLENLPQDIEEVPLIRFNPSGDYFVVISRVKYQDYRLEFWDYKQGILVYVEEIKGKIKEATWSSERKILFLGDYNFYNEKRIANNMREFVEQREILTGGSILSTKKEKITSDIQEEDWSRKKRNFITSDDSGKYISILNTSFNDNNVEIWEIASEKKIFSLDSDNKIKSIVFHPDGKQLIVFELLRDERIRITFWDIATKKQQRRFFIQSSLKGNTISPFDRSTALFFKNSNKVLLTGESVDIISLKNL